MIKNIAIVSMIISSLIGAVVAVRHTETFPEWQNLSVPETIVGIISINGINFALSKNKSLYVCPTILEDQECKNSPYPEDVPLIEEQIVTNTQKSLDCTSIQYLLDGFVRTYDTDVVACAITMNSAEQQSVDVAFVLDEAGEIWRWSPLRDGSMSTPVRGAIGGGFIGLILLTFYIAIRSISKRVTTRATYQFQSSQSGISEPNREEVQSSMKRKLLTAKQKRIRIAITCILFFTISQTAFGAGNQAERNHALGLHKTGLAGELLIATEKTITTQPEDVPVPKQLLAAEELLPTTVTFPSHLATEFVSPPSGTQTVTPDGDEIISLYLHVQRDGDTFPVMLIRVDSTDQEALVYAPAPPPIELSQGLGSMVDETRRQAIEQAYAAPVGGPGVRWASYIPTVIHDHAAVAIVIPRPDHATLFGLLWHSDSATMYVGGYLPYNDIQAIAEAFSH